MAVAFTFDDMQTGYLKLAWSVLADGRETSPRGMKTLELPSPVIELTNPRRAVASGIGRKVNLKLIAAEAAQLVGGFADPEMLVRVAPNMAQFQDGGAFYGAYGPRIRSQLPEAVKKLTRDFDSRQAQLLIWRVEDLFTSARDIPCTALMQFLVRDGKLELHVTMRSNDLWWGLTYDVPSFCVLQLTVAHWLNLDVGSYFHRPVSLHVYERDFENLEKLTKPDKPSTDLAFFKGKSYPWGPHSRVEEFVTAAQFHVQELVYGRAEAWSPEEEWYVKQLA